MAVDVKWATDTYGEESIHCNEIEKERALLYGYDKSLLDGCRSYRDLKELGQELADGRFCIDLSGWHFECLFHQKPGKCLYVIYAGARNHSAIPHFPRWSYYNLFDGGMLCVEDPMYYRYPKLRWGIHYGDKNVSCIRLSLEIIEQIRKAAGYEQIIFFSSSGGGYASLYAASLLPGALSLVVNPQIYPQKWGHAKYFQQITGIDLSKPDSFRRNCLVEQMQDAASRHVVLMNCKDNLSWQEQFLPLYKDLGIRPKYGIAEAENVLLWLYDCEGERPHNSFETKSIFLFMDHVAKCFQNNQITDDLRKTVLLVNECWHDIYRWKADAVRLRKKSKLPAVIYLGQGATLNIPINNEICMQGRDIAIKWEKFMLAEIEERNVIYSIRIRCASSNPNVQAGIYDRSAHRWLTKDITDCTGKTALHYRIGETSSSLVFCIDAASMQKVPNLLHLDDILITINKI